MTVATVPHPSPNYGAVLLGSDVAFGPRQLRSDGLMRTASLRVPIRWHAALVALCAACSHVAPSTVPTVFTRCTISDLGPVDSSWREVRASGFTFCVPPSWLPGRPALDSLDSRVWKGDGASVTWDVGHPGSIRAPDTRVISSRVVVVRGTAPPPADPAPPNRWPQSCSQARNTSFMIDSVVLVVTQGACRGSWTITAWSTAPAMYVQGEAHSPEGAKALNAMMVTIRFAPSGP